jgi:phage gpG-like protein
VTPQENLALLRKIRDRAALAAPGMAEAMGHAHRSHLKNVTLTRSGWHAPVTYTPAAPGSPPAAITGRLRSSIHCSAGRGGGAHASATVSANTVYAATQEFGGIHHGNPHMLLWVRYLGYAGVRARGWRRRTVDIPERPYMRPSRDDVIADGSVTRAGSASFLRQVFGPGF